MSCTDCHYFDSFTEKNRYKFCLFKGQYKEDLIPCEDFKEFVAYTPPPRKRRYMGDGSGHIQLHYHQSKKGKSYEQYYYHYEIWENGVRQHKGSRYIPKKKLGLIQQMDREKRPVTAILSELGLML